ncbi:MAG: replication-associated recombination protein A [Patescibacteria group bacterium]|nr:replication-associated recombination protein A [Patescibacteria group bacterium]
MENRPLADKMRPANFDEFFGQEEIVGEGKLLRKLIETDQLSSLVFWGPPGVGKTSLAYIIAQSTKARFVGLSAVESGKKDLLKAVKEAEKNLQENNEKTVLFIDEIHRWSKAQQDTLLPYVERGSIIMIGATTENPSFEIIGPLLSRSRVFILKKLENEDVKKLLKHALSDKDRGLGNFEIELEDETLDLLADLCQGDARSALNALELAVRGMRKGERGMKIKIKKEDIKEALQRTHLVFDKNGEEFYNIISALHKSMRGSDANAALYWLARMLEGGVDPLYVARRVLRFASEDIGMANSEAMIQANAAYDACHKLGMPECCVHLAQAVVYCAKSKKSNLLYTAYGKAATDARNTSHLGVPIHLRNAPTKFMKNIGYGKDYKYNPDFEGNVEQDYLPDELKNRNYFN